ncbi:protein Njmu-R1-like isoform X3 [Periplaneta americana]|uniref:protein Njmu-R1-like isoform X3 n=1 Tax=Periplaneta americana TaxID=6978 RepID=UPI0037E90C4D
MAEICQEEDTTDKSDSSLNVSYALYLYNSEILGRAVFEVNGNEVEIKHSTGEETLGFDLFTSPLMPEQEHKLRLFLVRRLRKGAIYAGTGNFSGMDFSLSDHGVAPSPAVCYYILLPCQQSMVQQVMICLLATTETNLEVFRPELTQFCTLLASHVPSDKEKPLPISVSARLMTWQSICLQYISRVLQALGPNIASLLQLAQRNGHVVGGAGVDQTLVDDVERFLEACTVAECLPATQSPTGEVAMLHKSEQLHVLDDVESNAYCGEWTRLLLDLGHCAEPWRLRRVLEAFKLKTIKDMNMLKRLLKQAEMDHYSLYSWRALAVDPRTSSPATGQ